MADEKTHREKILYLDDFRCRFECDDERCEFATPKWMTMRRHLDKVRTVNLVALKKVTSTYLTHRFTVLRRGRKSIPRTT